MKEAGCVLVEELLWKYKRIIVVCSVLMLSLLNCFIS